MDAGAIVIGAGHNGLICAAYLAKAGLSVLVIEARDTVGGCASTVDVLGGARVNICNCDHTMVRSTPILEELDLARHGLRYLDLDPPTQSIHWDGGPAWYLFQDLERTLESLRMTYPVDVDGYRKYAAAAMPIASLVLDLANSSPTPGAVLSQVARQRRALGAARLLQWSRRSVGDVVRSFFTTEQVRAPMFTTGPAVWGLGPETPGTGLGALGYAMRHVARVGRPEGGSGALPAAVLGSLSASGGRVRYGARVDRILVDGTKVRGVQLSTGEIIEAPIVVSAADPRRALVDWLHDPPANMAALIDRYRKQPLPDGYEAKLDAVVSGRPVYKAVDIAVAEKLGVSGDALWHPTTVVSSSLAAAAAAHLLARQGMVAARPMFLSNVPSVLDPTMRAALPTGQEVFSLEVLWTPYAIKGGWAGSPEPERWLRTFGGLVEGDFRGSVVDYRVMGPVDYEEQFQMVRGYAPGFAGTPLSAMLGRSRELTRYETAIAGLFLTGAGTFPGAGVWGASGRNTAAVVLRRQRGGLARRQRRRSA